MRRFDQHLHSWNSFDSKTPPKQNVLRALEVGLAGLTFTEHFDTHPSEWDACVYDDDKIARELAELRERHGDRIFIGKGIEVCYQPQRMPFILEFLQNHDFDLVILSVHWAFGKAVHIPEHFADFSTPDFINHYLEAVCDATAHIARLRSEGYQPFNILGHLDFAKRYANQHTGYDEPTPVTETVDTLLRNCLEADLIPEINTSTLRNGMSAPMPSPEILARYAELGGTMASLGSDAHSPQCIGSHFDRAVTIMQEAGINNQAVFHKGQCEPQPVANLR